MKEAEGHAETWVRIPPQLEERLEAVARALHCTVPEAALLAVRTQLDRLEAAADGSRRGVPAGGVPAAAGMNRQGESP